MLYWKSRSECVVDGEKETTKMSGKSVQRCGSNINVEMQMNNNSWEQLLDGTGLLFRVPLLAARFLRHAAWNARIVVSRSHGRCSWKGDHMRRSTTCAWFPCYRKMTCSTIRIRSRQCGFLLPLYTAREAFSNTSHASCIGSGAAAWRRLRASLWFPTSFQDGGLFCDNFR